MGETFLTVLVLLILGFFGFVVYFIFKQMQFVLVSVNLYKKMVRRQDAMVKLLVDIRDNTKEYKLIKESTTKLEDFEESDDDLSCPHCSAPLSDIDRQDNICSRCGKSF